MAYTKQTWSDNDPSKPVSAARMGVIENGIEATAIVADAASTTATAASSAASAAQTTANAAIPKSTVTTAGDIVYATGNAAVTRLGLGGVGTVLKGGASAPSFASIVDADISAAAALGIAKLQGYPTDATKFLRGDATWAVPATSADWTAVAATLTYSSTDGHTFVVTTGAVDLTASIPLGARIKLTHSASVKYFVVTAIDATTITLYGGTDYTLAATAITLPFYSQMKAPVGFPLNPLKWQEEFSDGSNQSQAAPVQNTWYNLGTATLAVPIGAWSIEYECALYYDTAAKEIEACLSTANNTKSDGQMNVRIIGVTGNAQSGVYRRKSYLFTVKTSLFMNARTQSAGGAGNLFFLGGDAATIIRATCAYL